MQSGLSPAKQLPSRGLKQVKVDNWGTFFLQRLQQLYFEEQLLDLTIKFPTSDITVQAHRLVITTCTDYFTLLERQQKEKDGNFDGVLVMPPEMPYECVKSIISFMYTGQLEYWTSEQNALYRTAQKMNMTVLTKLLDAQFNTSALQGHPTSKSKPNIQSIITLSKPAITPTKKTTTPNQTPTLPTQPLPGRKLPIWKRKLDSIPGAPLLNYDMGSFHNKSVGNKATENSPGPSRFDLPEVEDFALGVFSSFDDITYNTKPIVKAPGKYSNDGDTSNDTNFKRLRDEDRDGKNDTTEDEEEDHRTERDTGGENSDDDEWTGPKSILRPQESQPTPTKRVRFDLEEKENVEKTKSSSTPSPTNSVDNINNHAKIIREVLKKYPHLVKNNKNIRLKIMQKEAKSSEPSTPAKTKVSYVVLKSDHLMGGNNGESGGADESKTSSADGGEMGPWKCRKCDLEEEYTNYYMYRRHMQDVHEEKFDPRVCEHCGYKATKRNILMYHLYTKHNVPPPKNMCFPKCHTCAYVALSETLLVRHQINHNHRPNIRLNSSAEDLHCTDCKLPFSDSNELASHEINTGHGSFGAGGEAEEKGRHQCMHCNKLFLRASNLQVHIDCTHKELQDTDCTSITPPHIPLEPSSEAEALSNVASGIATSLGVGDGIPPSDQAHDITENQEQYIVPEMDLVSSGIQGINYNGQEVVGEGQQMVMLIDDSAYHHEQHQGTLEHEPQQLHVGSNEQIVMQGTEDGMIVYVHGNEDEQQNEQQTCDADQQTIEMSEETEEIVEEVVEEVEEEEVEVEEEEEGERGERSITEEDGNIDQVEEVIQYVEEETEIVEYQEEQSGENSDDNHRHVQESVMIIEEEEHVEEADDEMEGGGDRRENSKPGEIADEWDDDSADAAQT